MALEMRAHHLFQKSMLLSRLGWENVQLYQRLESCCLPPGADWLSLKQKLYTDQGITKKKKKKKKGIASNNNLIIRANIYLVLVLC